MRIIADGADWAGEMPAVLVAVAADADARRALLAALAARVLGGAREAVRIEHGSGRAPTLVFPPGAALHLSSASRAGVAALAVGRDRLGIDIEAVEPSFAPPWKVLRREEQEWLRALASDERPLAFARLWAAKEAYLKALGIGFARPPESFAVLPDAGGELGIVDPETGRAGVVRLATACVERSGGEFAVALAELSAAGPADVERPRVPT